MANETVTKVVQGVDNIFDEIVVNGRTVKSRAPSAHTTQTSPAPRAEPVEGQYVGAVQLNNIIHGLKDVPLNQRVENLEGNVSTLNNAVDTLNNNVDTLNSVVPSSASSSNKLTDKNYVDTEISDAIDDLDVPAVGGNGKYIKSIKQVNGKIEAEEDDLSSVGAGVAFIGTRAQYEQAKLIPLGQTGYIPSGSLVLITDEDAYIEGEDR